MYWRFTTVSELSDLPEAEQRQLWTKVGRDRSNRAELPLTALYVVVVVCCVWMPLALLTVNTWFRWPAACIGMMAVFKLLDVFIIWQRRRTIRRLRAA